MIVFIQRIHLQEGLSMYRLSVKFVKKDCKSLLSRDELFHHVDRQGDITDLMVTFWSFEMLRKVLLFIYGNVNVNRSLGQV